MPHSLFILSHQDPQETVLAQLQVTRAEHVRLRKNFERERVSFSNNFYVQVSFYNNL